MSNSLANLSNITLLSGSSFGSMKMPLALHRTPCEHAQSAARACELHAVASTPAALLRPSMLISIFSPDHHVTPGPRRHPTLTRSTGHRRPRRPEAPPDETH